MDTLQLKPVGQCMKLPTTNLYMESNQNTSFPGSTKGIDVSGSGTVDTKSGDGGLTASSVKKKSAASKPASILALIGPLTLVCMFTVHSLL